MEKQKWINLSDKPFKVEITQGKSISLNLIENPYSFKPVDGMWFSLPSDKPYISQWDNFLSDGTQKSEKLKRKIMDHEGKTYVTTITLKDTVYIVDLKNPVFRNIIENEMKNNKGEFNYKENRISLLEQIKSILKAKGEENYENFEYLILKIEEENFPLMINIENEAYKQKTQESQTKKVADLIYKLTRNCMQLLQRNSPNRTDFQNVKKLVLSEIYLLQQIDKKWEIEQFERMIQEIIFPTIYGVHDKDIFKIIVDKFVSMGIDNEDAVEIVNDETRNERKFLESLGSVEKKQLDECKIFLEACNSYEEFNNKREELISSLPQKQSITEWFSGCINEEIIEEYDMPSLVLFDTNCADVQKEERTDIFNSRRQLESQIISLKDIAKIALSKGITMDELRQASYIKENRVEEGTRDE